MSISAPSLEEAFFWRRFSALGWCSMHTILLQFFLLLTNHKKIFKNKLFCILLYVPAALCIYAFSISSNLTNNIYNLEYTYWGWINISNNTIWDTYYNLYYGVFSIVGIILLWNWGKKSNEKRIVKQSRCILSTFIIAIILGTLTDIILNSFLDKSMPQIAPIIILIPIFTIFYSIRKHGLMNVHNSPGEELILNDINRERMSHYFVISLITGSILNFISQYFIYNTNLRDCGLFSIEVILIAVSVELLQRLNIPTHLKNNYLVILISLAVILTTFQFVEYSGATIWAYPFIYIIAFIAFNDRKMLSVLAVVVVLSQIVLWILKPATTITIDGVDYFTRIVSILLAFGFARYINNIYITRLNENAEQMRYQKLIANISSEFITVDSSNLEEKINIMFKKCGKFFEVDRVYLFIIDRERRTMTNTYEWCKNGVEYFNDTSIEFSSKLFPLLSNDLKEKGMLYFPDMKAISEKESKEIRKITKRKILSLIAMPIVINGKIQGILGFETVRKIKKWDENHIDMLKIGANLLGDAVTKVNSEKMLDFMAYYDQLTKLPNHILFKEKTSQAIKYNGTNCNSLAVLFLDLDSFKSVNDTLGHEAGDYLLITLAKKISKAVSKNDVVARFGGDKYVILVNNRNNKNQIIRTAEKIMNIFNSPIEIKDQEFFITASMGVAIYPLDGEDVENLIKNAEVAMYNAKGESKNKYELCSQDMKDKIKRETELSNLLYRALEKNELSLYYQPQINVKSGKIVGLEALLRWENREFGNIPPKIFIPLAEKTGLINQIGEWVIRTACTQNKIWHDKGIKVRMAVNLSTIQFRNSNLVTMLMEIINETKLDPNQLEIEITESMLINDRDYLVEIMKQLKGIGIYLAIDDFGTEYSSLSRLNMLPIDRIKMDIRFVQGIEGNDKDRAIVNIIINLAKNLDIDVIAEGVENKKQFDFLAERMCDEIQGFYFYKPMTASEVEEILIDKR